MAGPDPERYQRALEALAEGARGDGRSIIDAAAEAAKAPVRERALRLLDQRARSRQELRERLLRADCEPDVVDPVLDDLAASGLIDDEFFAREWVRQRSRRLKKTARVLDRELADKGVGEWERQAALAAIDPEDEAARAVELAAKKASSIRQAPAGRADRDKELRRIVGMLARRGYPQSVAIRTAVEALDNRVAELEAEGAGVAEED